MLTRGLAVGALLWLTLAGAAEAGPVLDQVKAARTLSCGVLVIPEDYGKSDIHGTLDDFGADFCRAIAAGVLGDPKALRLTALPDEAHGFAALQKGTIDLLLGASPSVSAAITRGLRFTRPVFFDAESLMVHRDAGVRSFDDLSNRQVCFIANTYAEDVLTSEAGRRKMHILPFPFEEDGEMNVALLTRHCDAIMTSASRLADTRSGFHGRAKEFIILPDRLSADPMAPAIREGDPQWATVVDATLDALLLTESAGITKRDAAGLGQSTDPRLHALSGLVPGVDEKLVGRGWAARAVAAAGNYAEIYDRDLGAGSGMGLPRGMNALWNEGGLMVATPPR